MSTQIKGSKFIYEIDEKDFPHGFIAQGTESFVFIPSSISNYTLRRIEAFKIESKQSMESRSKIEISISEKVLNLVKKALKRSVIFICQNLTSKEFPKALNQIEIRRIRRQINKVDV